MKKFLLISIITILIIPQITFASWWNPFTWKIFQRKEPVPQVQVETQKTPEEKISELQKQIDDLKNQKTTINTEPSSPTAPKEQKKVITETNIAKTTQNCSDVYNPVCGEDNKTYTNFCSLAEGVNFKHSGVCANESNVLVEKKPVAISVPPPTAKQVAGLTRLCADAASQGKLIETCNSNTLWNNYYSDLSFRSKVDVLIAQYDAIKSTQSLTASNTQTNCDYTMKSSLLSQMTPWAGTLAIKEACGTATDGDRINYGMSELQHQLSGLKDTISKNQAQALQRADLERLQKQNKDLINSYSQSSSWTTIFENNGGKVFNSTGQSFNFNCTGNTCITY